MATINDKPRIDTIIANNGYYEDDPQVYMIVEYTNSHGSIVYGVTWVNQFDKERYLTPTRYIRNPKLIWCVLDRASD